MCARCTKCAKNTHLHLLQAESSSAAAIISLNLLAIAQELRDEMIGLLRSQGIKKDKATLRPTTFLLRFLAGELSISDAAPPLSVSESDISGGELSAR